MFIQIELPDATDEAHSAVINTVTDHLVMVMGDDTEVINAWLTTAKSDLNNQSPILSMKTTQGCHSVITLLRKILEQDSRIG